MRQRLATIGYQVSTGSFSIRFRLSSQWISFAAVLAVALLSHLLLPGDVAAGVLNPAGATVGVAAVAGIRRSRARLAWNLLAAGASLYGIGDMISLATSGPSAVLGWVYLGSFTAMAAGFTAFVARRR